MLYRLCCVLLTASLLGCSANPFANDQFPTDQIPGGQPIESNNSQQLTAIRDYEQRNGLFDWRDIRVTCNCHNDKLYA